MKVKANRGSLKLGNFSKLAARYCGPFEILERIGHVAYMLALPASRTIHNVFHVSLLKKYIHDDNHVIDWNVIHCKTITLYNIYYKKIFRKRTKKLQRKIQTLHRDFSCGNPNRKNYHILYSFIFLQCLQ
jgi:hypothetical protein